MIKVERVKGRHDFFFLFGMEGGYEKRYVLHLPLTYYMKMKWKKNPHYTRLNYKERKNCKITSHSVSK